MTGLCAIPNCRQRNRHLPTCTDDCLGCLPRLATEGLICDVDMARPERRLAEIIALTPDARATARGELRRGSGNGSGKPGSRPPLNVDATDTMNAIQSTLTTLARDIAETRGLQIPSAALGDVSPADPITRAAKWLTGQLDWLRHATHPNGEPYAASVFAEIRDCASRMRATVEGPADRRYLGPCGAERPCEGLEPDDWPEGDCGNHTPHARHDRDPCEGNVYARDGAPAGHCRTCGATVDTGERRAWLDAEVRSHTFRAIHIAQAYRISVDTIRSWAHRGLLVPHGHDADERPLFNVGDVLDLAAADAARREQARADRARRAAARTEGVQLSAGA